MEFKNFELRTFQNQNFLVLVHPTTNSRIFKDLDQFSKLSRPESSFSLQVHGLFSIFKGLRAQLMFKNSPGRWTFCSQNPRLSVIFKDFDSFSRIFQNWKFLISQKPRPFLGNPEKH